MNLVEVFFVVEVFLYSVVVSLILSKTMNSSFLVMFVPVLLVCTAIVGWAGQWKDFEKWYVKHNFENNLYSGSIVKNGKRKFFGRDKK